ncbi:MAG: tRNA uridine-5-carboxymethylaminomethyl(34) synthesis GTPase MnmE [Alphaproteobacteria bacterium]|nr:tRNA uridine-5-carboxymethylaminomethyl(34) synthesis GTPase MnmE [Alphaproteobacteria bacterium]
MTTIVAPASGAGRAGVAVIRVSGPAAAQVAAAVVGQVPQPRRAHRARFRHPGTGALMDHGLALWFPAPASFTGEDVLELQGHGGRAVVAGVLEAVLAVDGVRLAEPGEFTRRAFDNRKLDLTEVEALADLIAAETAHQARLALQQGSGALSRQADAWRQWVIRLLAHAEAAIDFVDEPLPEDLVASALAEAAVLADDIERALDRSHRAERLRRGLQVAIVGPPNVGKSSLLNRLAERDVAIVSPVAGTTRDVVEVHLDLNGWPVTLADTAGLRDTVDPVEQEGVRRSAARMASADLVLLLRDASATIAGDAITPPGPVIHVATKIDLAPSPPGWLGVSSATGAGLAGLLAEIEDHAARLLETGSDPSFGRERHRHALGDAVAALRRATVAALPELAAEDLRHAAHALGRIAGRVDVEDLLDLVFSEFCIGK